MASDQVQVIIRMQEGHVVLSNAAVHYVHQTRSGHTLNLYTKTLR